MQLTIIILAVIIVILLSSLILQHQNLKKMNRQLENIIQEFGTNELLRSNLPGKVLNEFIANINKLIALFKKEEQTTLRKDKEFRQEITNISHDIRTPLTSIKGFSELLQDPNLTPSEKMEYLDIVQRKVDTLLRIVNTFYEISQLESGDTTANLESFSLGDLLIETLLTFQSDFEKKNIAVSIDEDNLHKNVFADKKGTERIILNIIQNGLRYAQTFFSIAIEETTGELILEVKNDGYPISNSELSRIFDRSYTIDQSRQGGQTGFGLYIVKKMAESQGGKAEAFYEEGIFSLKIYFKKNNPMK